MTLQKEMIQRDVSPNSGGNFGSIRELYRVTDDAGAAITIIEAVDENNWGGTYPFARNTLNTSDATYYIINTSLTQPAPTVVDIAVEYTSRVSFLNKSSAAPQQADRSQPGYCSITTRYYSAFLDLWHRNSSGLPIVAPNPVTNDPYACESRYGDSVGAGNVDMAGQPISFPVVEAEVTISITRAYATSGEELQWGNIRGATGARLKLTGNWLGFPSGTLLCKGARVTETFADSLSVNYELSFSYSTVGHLRQIIGSMNSDGLPVIEADALGNFHASDVFVVQPFDTWELDPGGTYPGSNLITAQEYAILNGQVV